MKLIYMMSIELSLDNKVKTNQKISEKQILQTKINNNFIITV